MPTYISLINFTQKGAETIKDGPKRLEAAKQRFRDAGAELKAFYLVTGKYDAVSIVEAPTTKWSQSSPWDRGPRICKGADLSGVRRGRLQEDSCIL